MQDEISFSVLCGILPVKVVFSRELSAQGFCVRPMARIKLLLDVPRSYAMRTLESIEGTDSKMIVITWNSCPEYIEDLRDLQPYALLSCEFLLRQDLDDALDEVLNQVSDGRHYSYTPGPRTILTPAERAVLRYVARGWDNVRIGKRLHVEEQTIKNRLCAIYGKLGIHSRAEAILYYWQLWQ